MMPQNHINLKEIIDEDINTTQNIKRTKIAFADTRSKNVLYDQLANNLKNTSTAKKHVYKVHYKGEMIIIRFKSIKNGNNEEQIVEFEPIEKQSSKNSVNTNSSYSVSSSFKEILSQNISKKHASPVTKSPRIARILFFSSSYLLSALAYLVFDDPLNYISAGILVSYSTIMLFQFLRKKYS